MPKLHPIKPFSVWRDYEESVVQTALTPDGTKAITASIDGLSYIHYVHGTGSASTRVGVHGSGGHGNDGNINGVAISSDGRIAASAGMDNRVRVWDTATAAMIASFCTPENAFAADVTIARDCRVIAAAFVANPCFDRRQQATIAIFELDESESKTAVRTIMRWPFIASRRVRLAISADGSLLANTVSSGVTVVDIAKKKVIAAWKTAGDASIAFDSSASRIAIADSRSLRICPIAGSRKSLVVHNYKASLEPTVAFEAHGKYLAASIRGGIVRLYDGITGAPLNDLYGPKSDVTSLSMSLDGSFVLGSSLDRRAYIWRLTPVRSSQKLIAPNLSCARRLVAIEEFNKEVKNLARIDTLLHVQAQAVLLKLLDDDDLELLENKNKYFIAEKLAEYDLENLGSVDEKIFLQVLQDLENCISESKKPSEEEIVQKEFVDAAGHLEWVVTIPVAASIIEKRVKQGNKEIRNALAENSNGVCASYDELVRTIEDLS